MRIKVRESNHTVSCALNLKLRKSVVASVLKPEKAGSLVACMFGAELGTKTVLR